jgi:hypothetical protein
MSYFLRACGKKDWKHVLMVHLCSSTCSLYYVCTIIKVSENSRENVNIFNSNYDLHIQSFSSTIFKHYSPIRIILNHSFTKYLQHKFRNLMCSMPVHYIIQNTNHQQMHKESFIINRNTLLLVSTLLGHLQGELSPTVTLGVHFTVEWECAVDCVLRCFWRRELSAVRA